MPKIYEEAEAVSTMAQGLIANYHPELSTARIMYVFVDKASTKGGRDVFGKARKVSGLLEWALERDFIMEVALDKWNDLQEHQRHALVDHLLECCFGVEDEQSGEMKWTLRDPDVQEFSTILQRHGAWNDSLSGFVSVAQQINLRGIVEDVDEDMAESLTETVN